MAKKRKSERNIALLAIIVITAVLLIIPWSLNAGSSWAQDSEEPWKYCNPGGVFTGIHPPMPWAYIITETIIPTDPVGNTITFIWKADNSDPTLGDPNPPLSEVDHMTDFVGNGIRTGPNTWDYTGVAYGTKKVEEQPNPEIVYIAVVRGTVTYADDCNSKESQGMFALYLPEQDVDGDGFPDEDQTPVYCGPSATIKMTRLPMVPPCVPPPTPPEGE